MPKIYFFKGWQNTGVSCFSELFKQAVISKAIIMDEITGEKYKHNI